MWDLMIDFDPAELLRSRERQKMDLARYGHQSVLQWADVEVREIRRMARLLQEIVSGEGPTQRLQEGS